MTAGQKLKFVFLLGRGGCGKSAAFRVLASRLESAGLADDFERLDDFPKLWDRFMADDRRAAQGKERLVSGIDAEGRYYVTDHRVFDVMLAELSRDVEHRAREGKIIFIEFARGAYVPALKCFSAQVLDSALIVYIDCPFEVCWDRNVRRGEVATREGTDDHLVPREDMEKLYRNDDRDELERQHRGRVVIINNEREGVEFLEQQADEVLTLILSWR